MTNPRHALARLGTTMDATDYSALSAMERAGLSGWDLQLSPLFTERDEDTLEVPFGQAITRSGKTLGVVGSVYKPSQNEDYAKYLDYLTHELQASIEYAGEIDGGRQVFFALRLKDALVNDRDPITLYAVLVIDHSGNSAPSVRVMAAHEVTQSLVFPSISWNLYHGGQGRVAVNSIRREAEMFLGDSEKLASVKFSVPEFATFAKGQYGAGDSASLAAQTRAQNKIDLLMDQFRRGLPREGVGASLWGALVAVCAYDDHYSPVRGAGGLEAVLRARRAILKPGSKVQASRDLAHSWGPQ